MCRNPKTAVFSNADGTEDCACYYFFTVSERNQPARVSVRFSRTVGQSPIPSTLAPKVPDFADRGRPAR